MADTVSWPGDLETLVRATSVLRTGGVLAIATDTGVDALASALDPAAVAKLSHDPAIALATSYEIFDWIPAARGAALRMARDFWPGRLTLVSDMGAARGLSSRLPTATLARVRRPEGIAVRLLPHDSLAILASAVGAPLVIAPLEDADKSDLLLAIETPGAPNEVTEVVAGARTAVIRKSGAILPADFEFSRRCRIILLCTGNTCRSPMAKVLCERLLADTLGVPVGNLANAGFEVESAGLAAAPGKPASPEAVAVAASFGGDLAGHESRPVSIRMIDRADFLFTMTFGHLRMLQSLRIPVGPEPQLLSPWDEDVSDPIGGPVEMYRECAEQILESLRGRLPQILEG